MGGQPHVRRRCAPLEKLADHGFAALVTAQPRKLVSYVASRWPRSDIQVQHEAGRHLRAGARSLSDHLPAGWLQCKRRRGTGTPAPEIHAVVPSLISSGMACCWLVRNGGPISNRRRFRANTCAQAAFIESFFTNQHFQDQNCPTHKHLAAANLSHSHRPPQPWQQIPFENCCCLQSRERHQRHLNSGLPRCQQLMESPLVPRACLASKVARSS